MTAEPLPPTDPSGTPARPPIARPLRPADEISHEAEPERDMSFYPQLIKECVIAADRGDRPIDHLTARRMALMLLSQSRDRKFSRGLARFASDGSVTGELWQSLRRYAWQPAHHPHQHHSWRLLNYAVARGTNLGPLRADFGATCNQADQLRATCLSAEERVEIQDDLFEDAWEAHLMEQCRLA